MQSTEDCIQKIQQFKQEFQAVQFLLAIENLDDLHFNSDLILQSPWHSFERHCR
ncbi:hypothetical protein THIOSC13_10006 [uncultured Thiomicrorhabdus sp.]